MAGRKTKYTVSLLVNKIWNGIFQLTNYIDYKTMVVVENETQEMFVVRYDDFLIKCRDPRYKGKRRSLKEIEEAVEKAQPDFKLKQYNNLLDMIVVDSVAALVPQAELDGEIGKATVALQARLMSPFLRRIISKAAKYGTTCIFINFESGCAA